MRRFDGKVALVTGGSSGIGRATAVAFACEGARVVIAARSLALSLKSVWLCMKSVLGTNYRRPPAYCQLDGISPMVIRLQVESA